MSGMDNMVVKKEEVIRFIRDCMTKVGVSDEDSEIIAHHLMVADYRGHFSHGMNRVPMYINHIIRKLTDPRGRPKIISDFQAISLVDGQNGFGQVIGKYCMEMAISKARKFGIGMVSARGSNHFGICGYYSMMAANEGFIGFSCTNARPLLVPTRSIESALGTNPFSLAFKSPNDEFVLDMATTVVALGKIELALKKEEDIPDGWALGSDGKNTNNAHDALETRKLLPLGGNEDNSGYKGYGMSLMIEILCGILSGSSFGPNIRDWELEFRNANLGQCFLAINPEVFCPGATERLDELLGQLRNLEKDPDCRENIMVAGDPEKKSMADVNRNGGIQYHNNQIKACNNLAESLGVSPIKLSKKNH